MALFAADGMTLEPSLIPEDTALTAFTLTREEALEEKAAAFLLGETPERTVQGGGICSYTGERGAAMFRDTGSFDAAGTLSETDGMAWCASFCREFSYDTPVFTLDDTASGTGTAVRLWNGVPVVNSTVTFTLDNGAVVAVSGSLLPSAASESPEQTDLLSAFAALTAFQQMRHESSSVVSTITEIRLCYELQSTAASPMMLVPAWHIVTDTASFYVNAFSGTVRRA